MTRNLDERLEKEFNRFGLHHEEGYFDALVATLKSSYNLKGKRIFEFGCGTGDFLLSLSGSGAITLTGVDISEISIQEARKKLIRDNSAIQFICANVLKDSVWVFKQDIIISHSVLQYMTDIDAVFIKFHEILSSGGVVFMTILQRPSLPIFMFQWFSLYCMPQVVKERFHWIFRFPGFGNKLSEGQLSNEVLKSKSRYLGIPVVQNQSPQLLRAGLERAGFVDVNICEAPRLSRLSAPHYLITARKA